MGQRPGLSRRRGRHGVHRLAGDEDAASARSPPSPGCRRSALPLSVPFYIWGFTAPSLLICAIGLSVGHFIKYGYLAAQYTISQGVVSMQRARDLDGGDALRHQHPRLRPRAALRRLPVGLLLLRARPLPPASPASPMPGATPPPKRSARQAAPTANVAEVLASMARPITEAQYAFCGPAQLRGHAELDAGDLGALCRLRPVLLRLHVHAEEGHGVEVADRAAISACRVEGRGASSALVCLERRCR